jgi:hypothetical protein
MDDENYFRTAKAYQESRKRNKKIIETLQFARRSILIGDSSSTIEIVNKIENLIEELQKNEKDN